VRAVLLDALGTLVELEPPAPRLRRELARRGHAIGLAEAERAMAAEIAYYRAHLDAGRDPAALADLRRRCAEAMGRELPGLGLGGEALTEVLLASISFRAFADAPAALASLRARGLRLVVASNWDVSLPDVLGRVGLLDHLDGVITSAQVGARKPDTAVFEAALQLAGVEPGEAVHVGDRLQEDVAGARAAGIEPVLVARSGAVPAPSTLRCITSLAELV
jgi:putative hydrolase of the HAD superfamily